MDKAQTELAAFCVRRYRAELRERIFGHQSLPAQLTADTMKEIAQLDTLLDEIASAYRDSISRADIRVTVIRNGQFVEIFECSASAINEPWFSDFTRAYMDVDDLTDRDLHVFISPAGEDARQVKSVLNSEVC